MTTTIVLVLAIVCLAVLVRNIWGFGDGSWFGWGERRLGQGRNNVLVWLRENPDELQALASSANPSRSPGHSCRPR